VISSQRIWDRGAALTSTLHWFETEVLTKEENLIGLMALNRGAVGRAESLDGSEHVVLDMDSSESPVHVEQEGSAYDGHFESVPANDSLERDIAKLLKCPLGRPNHKPVIWYKGFLYQAASWKAARRVVAKVGIPCRRAVSASRLRRHESELAQPGGSGFL
jgi:hypothetical protein